MRASLQIKYHQESEVHVTKLGDGPNSLVPSDEGFPTTRLKCFPLYSVLLAYNATTLDYLSLDSSDVPEGQVSHARFRQLVASVLPFRATEISLASSVSMVYYCYRYSIVKPRNVNVYARSLFVLPRLKKAPINSESTVDYVRR